jgi:D-tyrosyl-tRNA(Tyr) deacylase
MRAVLTRVKEASVRVEGELVSEIGQGFLVLLGVSKDDGEAELRYIADRISGIRIFSDSEGKMNLAPRR